MILHLDCETYSAYDLKRGGVHNYARHPTTGVHCVAFAFDEEPVCLWVQGHPVPDDVVLHIELGGLVWAHNEVFEREVLSNAGVKYGWPVLKPEQMVCTLAMCYAMGLPGSLERAAAALGLEARKDMSGHRVMMQLAQPREWVDDHTPIFWGRGDNAVKFEQLYSYCMNDVEVERAIGKRVMALSPAERRVFALDQRINNRGVGVDVPAVRAAIKLVESEKKRLDREMSSITGGVVSRCSEVARIKQWLLEFCNVEQDSLAKQDVIDLLIMPQPANVRRVLELRQEAGKASTAKLKAMVDRAGADGRARGLYQFHGASTGRWSGRAVQTQNMPRTSLKWTPEFINGFFELLGRGEFDGATKIQGHSPLFVVSDLLRGFLVAAPGHEFIGVDFASIEARVTAWIAGEQSVLDVFESGKDIYKYAAMRIYGVAYDEVTKEQRQIGKVAVLALGYQGGVGAFQTMAKTYGVKVPDKQADEIKKAWRIAHPKIVAFWKEIEETAISAVLGNGVYEAGSSSVRKVSFVRKGSFLWCRLPSGRVLCYPYPKIEQVETPWKQMKDQLTYMNMDSETHKWERQGAYGGLLTENVVQAISRDLLSEAMLRVEAAGFPIAIHVHDEIVVEVPVMEDPRRLAVRLIEDLIREQPKWAVGLPIGVESWTGRRFRKQ